MKSKFAVGNKWICNRTKTNGRPDFYFVIIDKGDKPSNKLCRIELVNPDIPYPEREGHGTEQIYSHKHIKKYATFIN